MYLSLFPIYTNLFQLLFQAGDFQHTSAGSRDARWGHKLPLQLRETIPDQTILGGVYLGWEQSGIAGRKKEGKKRKRGRDTTQIYTRMVT